MKQIINKIIMWFKGYKLSHYGMCPECTKKNKDNLTLCNHGMREYWIKK